MNRAAKALAYAMFAALLGCAAGCFGLSQNPSYFPYLWPTGDVIKTHAKPHGLGYYANFDPYPVKLVVEKLEATNQVSTQHVLLATVYDAKGDPLRGRRFEWKIEGVGSIIEVDEHGHFPGRGYIEGRQSAVSYGATFEKRLSRGNKNPNDDVMIRPGQSWCVVDSPVEGDTYITVCAPGIYDWDKRTVHAVVHWVDATWELPPPVTARFGTEPVLTTKIFRFTDRKPLKGYEVRYKILDGPPAMFTPTRTQEFVAVSDLSGNAQATLAQTSPGPGVNRISVEIIRPPDPTLPSGSGVPIVRGETTVRWQAPNVSLAHSGPAQAAVGQEIVYGTTAVNNGDIDSKSMTITNTVPAGMEYVRSTPPAAREGNQLIWTFGTLPPGQKHEVQAVYKAPPRTGAVTSIATLATEEGQRDQKEAVTQITMPDLKVNITAPPAAAVGTAVPFRIRLSNAGTGPVGDIDLLAVFDAGLEHESKQQRLQSRKEGLAPGESREEVLMLRPIRAGQFRVQVNATGSGQSAQAMHILTVTEPQVALSIDGPPQRYVGRPAEFKIRVLNGGESPLGNVVIRTRLPAELEFTAAPQGGQLQGVDVVWNLGTIQPKEERVLELITKAVRGNPAAEVLAVASTDGGLSREARARIRIDGIAAIHAELNALSNPVEVGKSVVYRLKVQNTGSSPLNKITVRTTASPELKPISAKGPRGQEQIADRVVMFEVVDGVAPGAEVTYFIECRAEKEGDARFQAEISSDITDPPLVRQEATRVIAPLGGAGPGGRAPEGDAAPPPPPPPGGGKTLPIPPGM